jgi:hypothetical protein
LAVRYWAISVRSQRAEGIEPLHLCSNDVRVIFYTLAGNDTLEAEFSYFSLWEERMIEKSLLYPSGDLPTRAQHNSVKLLRPVFLNKHAREHSSIQRHSIQRFGHLSAVPWAN